MQRSSDEHGEAQQQHGEKYPARDPGQGARATLLMCCSHADSWVCQPPLGMPGPVKAKITASNAHGGHQQSAHGGAQRHRPLPSADPQPHGAIGEQPGGAFAALVPTTGAMTASGATIPPT